MVEIYHGAIVQHRTERSNGQDGISSRHVDLLFRRLQGRSIVRTEHIVFKIMLSVNNAHNIRGSLES